MQVTYKLPKHQKHTQPYTAFLYKKMPLNIDKYHENKSTQYTDKLIIIDN